MLCPLAQRQSNSGERGGGRRRRGDGAAADDARRQILESGGILEDDYKPLLERYLAGGTARGAAGVYQTPEDCAAVVLGVIGQDRPPLRLRTSAWAEAFTRLKTEADPDGTRLTAEVIAAMLGGGG